VLRRCRRHYSIVCFGLRRRQSTSFYTMWAANSDLQLPSYSFIVQDGMTTVQLINVILRFEPKIQLLNIEYDDKRPNNPFNYDGYPQLRQYNDEFDDITAGSWTLSKYRRDKGGATRPVSILDIKSRKALQRHLKPATVKTVVFFAPLSGLGGHFFCLFGEILHDSLGGVAASYDLPPFIKSPPEFTTIAGRSPVYQHPRYMTCGLHVIYRLLIDSSAASLPDYHPIDLVDDNKKINILIPTHRMQEIDDQLVVQPMLEMILSQNEDTLHKMYDAINAFDNVVLK